MMVETNPLRIKEKFIATLNETKQDSKSIENLLKCFCRISWWLDNEQLDCFERLKQFVLLQDQTIKREQKTQLINMSKDYPRLILLAEEMFNSLPAEIQKSIKIPMIYWTMDDSYTSISENEYKHRLAYGKKAWIVADDYRRPSQPIDFICYEKVLDMICRSGQSTLIYCPGW